MTRRALLPLALALALSSQSARAGRCHRGLMPPRLPNPLGFGAYDSPGLADFATTPSPCAHTGFMLEGRGAALIDTPDFYGVLTAEAVISASYAVSDRLWLTAALV